MDQKLANSQAPTSCIAWWILTMACSYQPRASGVHPRASLILDLYQRPRYKHHQPCSQIRRRHQTLWNVIRHREFAARSEHTSTVVSKRANVLQHPEMSHNAHWKSQSRLALCDGWSPTSPINWRKGSRCQLPAIWNPLANASMHPKRQIKCWVYDLPHNNHKKPLSPSHAL